RRRARAVGQQRDLAEPVARSEIGDLPPALRHASGARDQYEELAPGSALAREHGPLPHVEVVGTRCQLPPLALRAPAEQRHLLQEVDLGVSAQRHGAILNGTSCIAT